MQNWQKRDGQIWNYAYMHNKGKQMRGKSIVFVPERRVSPHYHLQSQIVPSQNLFHFCH